MSSEIAAETAARSAGRPVRQIALDDAQAGVVPRFRERDFEAVEHLDGT